MIHFEQVSKIFQTESRRWWTISRCTSPRRIHRVDRHLGFRRSHDVKNDQPPDRTRSGPRCSLPAREDQSFKPQDLRRRMSYAIQSRSACFHWTVEEEHRHRAAAAEMAARASFAIGLPSCWSCCTGTGSVSPSLPHQLSGGQQQRVELARALAADPGVVDGRTVRRVGSVTRAALQAEIARIHQISRPAPLCW